MKKLPAIILAVVVLLGVSACGGAGEGEQSLDYNAISQKFVDLIFAGNFVDANAMVGKDYSEDVAEDINQFSGLWAKYQFQEVKINVGRGWGPANFEIDKRAEVVFQYADKGKDNWAIGTLYVRIKSNGNTWEIADLQLIVPTN